MRTSASFLHFVLIVHFPSPFQSSLLPKLDLSVLQYTLSGLCVFRVNRYYFLMNKDSEGFGKELKVIEFLLCSRYSAKCLTGMPSFNSNIRSGL